MGDKSVDKLRNKIDFCLGHIFPPSPPNNVDFSISSTAQTTVSIYTTLH